jgi:hypothetical protein
VSEIEVQWLGLSDRRCESRLAVFGIAKPDSSGPNANIARQDLSQVSARDYEMLPVDLEMKAVRSGVLVRGKQFAQTCNDMGRGFQ